MSKAMDALEAINEHKCGCNNQGCGYALNDEHVSTLRDYITTAEARIKELEEALAEARDGLEVADSLARGPGVRWPPVENALNAVNKALDGARKVE